MRAGLILQSIASGSYETAEQVLNDWTRERKSIIYSMLQCLQRESNTSILFSKIAAEINNCTNTEGQTALHLLVLADPKKEVEKKINRLFSRLVEIGVSFHQEDDNKDSPLDLIKRHNRTELFEILKKIPLFEAYANNTIS